MEPRVSLITLGVADLGRAQVFYEALGWRRSGASVAGEVAFYQAGGLALALWSWRSLAADAGLPEEGGGFRRVALAHNVADRADVDRLLAEAAAAGAVITKLAQDSPHFVGRSGYFADPDGHLWEVAWNPAFALGPDGALTLPP
ncbi:MAG: VOC family protein [Hyphomonadaceae bacterium]|nr:VOC family protein [Hyphomonadaceae bacterium]